MSLKFASKKNALIWIFATFLLSIYFIAIYKLHFEINNFDKWSEYTVVHSIYRSIDEGIFFEGGYMVFIGKKGIKKLNKWDFENDKKDYQIYNRQYGLQYKIYSLFAPNCKENFIIYFYIIKYLTALAFAITMMGFIYAVKREFGQITAIVLYFCLFLSPAIVYYASNLYWVVFTFFLPFTFAWLFYDKLRDNRIYIFYIVISILIIMKSLCGFEFITNIILSASIPIIYYEVKNKTKFTRIVKKIFFTVSCGIIGFFIALFITIHQGYIYYGSFSKAITPIINKALMRTIGDQVADKLVKFSLQNDLITYKKYLDKPVFFNISNSCFLLFGTIILCFFSCFLLRQGKIKSMHSEEIKKCSALIIATFISYIASFSWFFIAFGHARYHILQCLVLFYLPLILMFYIAIPLLIKESLNIASTKKSN